MSVSMLCEGLAKSGKLKAESRKLKAESSKRKMESGEFNLEVFTTTANGRNELDVESRKPIFIDGVPVTYFKRWTKDHSHFSPGLLWRLRKVLLESQKWKAESKKQRAESGICNPSPISQTAKINPSEGRQKPPRLAGTPPKEGNEIVIHIHAWWNLVSVLSCFVAKWYKIPVVLSPRGMLTTYSQNNSSSFSKKILQWLIGDRLLRYCHIHVTSEQEKQDVLKIIQPRSINIISNLVSLGRECVEPQVVSSKYQISSSKYQVATSEVQKSSQILNLIFLSRIEKKKGLELLFDALSKLDFEFNLTIAGSGEEEYVKSLKLKAKSLRLEDRLTWIGQVGNDEKFSIMAAHDLLVLPSYNENFANVVVESLSIGTPVLISENVGLADYVKANELGWICSLEPKDIAEKIIEANASIAKREKISSIAPIMIKNDFNDEVLIGRYLELYEDVLGFHSEN